MSGKGGKDVWPLAEALASLRNDLITAQEAGDGKGIRFDVEHIDLDLQVSVTTTAKGGVKLGWGLVNANMGGDVGALRTHGLKMRLTLSPNEDGAPHKISNPGARPVKVSS